MRRPSVQDSALAIYIAAFSRHAESNDILLRTRAVAAFLTDALSELRDRRAADVSEFAKLERSIAYGGAVSIIDCCCASVSDDKDDLAIWFDIEDVEPLTGNDVAEAVEYLEGRGLIHRHIADRNLIQVCNEDEAQPAPHSQPVPQSKVQE